MAVSVEIEKLENEAGNKMNKWRMSRRIRAGSVKFLEYGKSTSNCLGIGVLLPVPFPGAICMQDVSEIRGNISKRC